MNCNDNNKNILIIFDFDNTILNGTAINHLIRLFLSEDMKKTLK